MLKLAFISSGMQLLSSGSDGLLKLWNIKTSECVDSFDGHEDKVWALAAAPGDDSVVATGAADGLVNIWSDSTGALEDQARVENEERLELEQQLANALRSRDVRKAALLALRLDHPAKLLQVVKQVLQESGAETVLCEVAGALQKEQVAQVLRYVRDWNTTGRNSAPAQALLHAVLTRWPVRQLEQVEDVRSLVDALIPYTHRHLQRLEECQQRSYMLDFTLHAMQESLGGDEGDASDSQEGAMALQQAHKTLQIAGSREAGARGKGVDDDEEDDEEDDDDEEEGGQEKEDEEEEEEEEEAGEEEEEDVDEEEQQAAKRSRRHAGSRARRAAAVDEVAAEVEEDRKKKRTPSRDTGHDDGEMKDKLRESQRAHAAGMGERQPRSKRVTALPVATSAPREDATPLKRSRQGEEEASTKASSKRASRATKSAKKATSE